MPMFRRFVPRSVRPWTYLLMAVTFQLSGGLYLGTLNQMMGDTCLMREDLQMCLYANLAGMAIWFPVLFRMKFRFTNKTLLTASAAGILCCNLIVPHVTFLPLLWALCFVSGICKIQGTFECMSNIQLWMTPKRDFTVFFPLLHIVILGSMQASDWISVQLAYYFNWTYMQWFVSGLMLLDLIFIFACTRHFRMIKKFPLFGIDWLGAALWAALLLIIAYVCCYGSWYDWWNSPVIWQLCMAAAVTLALCIWRMLTVRHPYYEPQMWTYRHLLPVLLLITLVEGFLATEHVLEETFIAEVMGYGDTTSVWLDLPGAAGILAGCLFAYWWMHVRRFNYLRLIIVGLVALSAYQVMLYFTVSSDIAFHMLYLPTACRNFAYAVLSSTFFVCLEEIMTFPHFFQALSVFNMLHMVVGGVLGAAIYSEAMSYYVADNMARYGAAIDNVSTGRFPAGPLGGMEGFVEQMMEISIKQIYGWVAYACILLLLLFLLYDAPVRRQMKPIPGWRRLRHEMAVSLGYGRKKHRAGEQAGNIATK